MQIGALKLVNPLVMAPLAGITNLPFRLLAREAGAGLVCSEMVSANGLIRKGAKTLELLRSIPAEKPLSIQLFGAEPDIMAEAAAMAAAMGADILDINCGCAVKKIVRSGSGVALMGTPIRAQRIFEAVRRAVAIPLTIKIRSGWDAGGDTAVDFARMAEACGVDALTVHPRTATQAFRGRADWSIITRIKAALSIPVIGNGDVQNAADALRMRQETACDGIMIGRAAIGHPLIFRQILYALHGGITAEISLAARFSIIQRYVTDSVLFFGEKRACRMLRGRLNWFIKGLPHNVHFREAIKTMETADALLAAIATYHTSLGVRDPP